MIFAGLTFDGFADVGWAGLVVALGTGGLVTW